LWVVVCLAFGLLMAALYIPWAADVLRFATLPAHELAAASALGLLSVVWFEVIKWLRRSRQRGRRKPQGKRDSATGQAM
jgi:Ca2+-transporting ATPase